MSDPPPPPPPPQRGGLSLYDNLTDPNDPTPSATISSAPVLYSQAEQQESKKPIDPALRFQPIRRPQVKQPAKRNAPLVKPAAPKPAAAGVDNATTKSTAADWIATEEDQMLYGVGGPRHQQRSGRKKKKKKQEVQVETDWNELYDPARPTDVDEYLKSDEKIDEVREWRALLYRHRKKDVESDISDSDEDARPAMPNQFAPPPSFNAFAPPPISPPSAPPPDDDSQVLRQTLTQDQAAPPPASYDGPSSAHQDLEPPPPTGAPTISSAPVHYAQPSPPAEQPPPQEPPTRTNRPGQAGFASRLMQKYGWSAGTGLGASSSGIVAPLRVQVEKRKKKADADGGGWAGPAGKGKIIGGKRADGENDGGKFGTMSEVIVLGNMLENMPDLQGEMEDGLGQEIGEECGEKYGRVERLYIDQENRQVFIKFTDQVSALRAVNELDGRVFNGNTIVPKFYDVEKFEGGIYI